MKRSLLFLLVSLVCLISFPGRTYALYREKVDIKFFYSPSCKHCIEVKEKFLPEILKEYKDFINVEYFNTAEPEDFQKLLAIEKEFNVRPRVPSILIGKHFLIGVTQIESEFEDILKGYLQELYVPKIQIGEFNILEKFHSFSALTVVAAGLVDGINPCAFTVLLFFISFLTLMGYKKKDLVVIGLVFVLAVFITYLAIGLGIFRGFYELKNFYLFLQGTYFGLSLLCFFMAYLNLRDFFVYRKTRSADSLKVKLPRPIRQRINAIISKYYRKSPETKPGSVGGLVLSTFLVGFLISLLEAVCTGQVYLPTIVFILKEPGLRLRALFFLLLYNFMFIVPLLLILLLVVLGTNSNKLEGFFRQRVGLVKILMFLLFVGLGLFLLIKIY